MKFDEKKKEAILLYILEKIERGDRNIVSAARESFEINESTVYQYLKELVEKNILKKVSRGKYELVQQEFVYELQRSKGELESDTDALEHDLKPLLQGYARNVIEIWEYTFSEMMNNVIEHSAAEHVKLTIRQTYLKTSVRIEDDGVGIFNKIQKYFGFASTEEAICELFKGKLTTDSQNHSGEGIFFSSKIMDDFYILSSGKVFTNNILDASELKEAAMDATGTCVVMDLSNFTHKTTKEVFDLYSNDEGSFLTTKIPMKNIFDTTPVSRSQAKRVCNRLEKFTEVIIDFQGIDWMGQGFAHQVFSVFAKAHPEIKLTPINMNEDVTKMYIHVTEEH